MQFTDIVAKFGKPLAIDQQEHVFRQGDANRNFYIVQNGLLKAYYLTEDGKEYIKSFLMPGDVIGSLSAMRGKEGCSFNLVSLKPCKLIKVSFDKVFVATLDDPQLGRLIADFLITFGMKKEKREYELLCLSAEERYRQLLANQPELFKAVQQNDIALYLGVTPVGLSRIKQRIGP